jgi:UPF0755 protein
LYFLWVPATAGDDEEEGSSMTIKSKLSSFPKLRFLLLALFIVSTLLTIGVAYWFQRPLNHESKVVLIEKGTSLSQIANLLNQEDILDFPFLFKGIVYGTRNWNQLKAGEYFIPANVTPAKLLQILKSGEVILHPVTLIPGETSHDFMQKLLSDTRFEGPCELPLEGSLLPETYHFPRGTERRKIISGMKKMMEEKLKEIWAQRPTHYFLQSPKELVTLASIVEKETALTAEKPIVAAVFLNRLAQNIPLQADPTVLYSLTQGKGILERELTSTDLAVQSPYNTYMNLGLPPLPIANPSLSTLLAVLHPADVPYLYFVADGKGGHVFSSNLGEHQKNQAKWRKWKKEINKNVSRETF